MLSEEEKRNIEAQEFYRAEIRAQIEQRKAKSKGMAIFLSVFLGGIGAHKFYLRQYGWGILYLVCSWTGIPMILGLIEGLVLATLSDSEFLQKFPQI